MFWLDVEHFKQFDGGDEDLKLFAHHIGKYEREREREGEGEREREREKERERLLISS